MTASRLKISGAAVATAIAFFILVALGIWQIHRLHWKQAMLAQIEMGERSPPRPLLQQTPPLFTRVSVTGVLRNIAGLYGAELRGETLGGQQVELLDRPHGKPLLVVLGWTGDAHPVTGPVNITGYVRLPERPTFLSAPDDPGGRRFYTLDPAAMGAALGAPDAAPFVLVALSPAAISGPIPADSLPRPVNNHLQYALTWFGLAASLLGVFVPWRRSSVR